MFAEIAELQKRVDKIERQKDQEVLALVEILSNATFFGELTKASCEYAKNGQCSFFVLGTEAKNKIPIARECLINGCKEPSLHCHLEISNISCTFCQRGQNGTEKHSSRKTLRKSKEIPQTSGRRSSNARIRIEGGKE